MKQRRKDVSPVMINHLTPKAEAILNCAMENAREMGHTYIGTEHLLIGLCGVDNAISARIMRARGVQSENVRAMIQAETGIGERSAVTPADMTPRVRGIIENAATEAMKMGKSRIGSEHLLLSLLNEKSCVAVHLLEAMQIPVNELKGEVQGFLSLTERAQSAAVSIHDREVNNKVDSKGSGKSSPLQSYGRNLSELAANGKLEVMIGREQEIERLIQVLSRRTKNNPCLIGEPGVGKTAVVEGLASKIVNGAVPSHLLHKQIISLDMAGMLAGAKYRGEFEERFKNVMSEVSQNPDIILFIDEIHVIVGAGAAEGAIDAANIIKPALARGEIQLIGATTLTEYRRYIEKDAALERRFQSVLIQEPSEKECLTILRGLRESYERHHGVRISEEAMEAAVALSERYIPDRFLPDKALDLLDEAASRLRITLSEKPPELSNLETKLKQLQQQKEEAILTQDFERAATLRDICRSYEGQLRDYYQSHDCPGDASLPVLKADEIAEIVRQWTGIPASELLEEESQKLIHLEATLASRIVGQEKAVHSLAQAIRRSRTGLKDPDRPIGSFLFIGPSGVGKTELCLALADALFGSESALIRLDMSEYMEKHSVSKMIGSPPGYVGFEEGGQLTEKIRRQPYAVVLFDEIEKAHPEVYNLLLQVLEDGCLTDSQGRRVDFRNAILILTSNVGSSLFSRNYRPGFSSRTAKEDRKDRGMEYQKEELYKTFPPEFLNRLDDILWFSPLTKENYCAITTLMLKKSQMRARQAGITVDFHSSVATALISDLQNSDMGARPLRRAITENIENMLANAIISGEIRIGDSVEIYYEDTDGYQYRIASSQ